jgi:hypothetical protein
MKRYIRKKKSGVVLDEALLEHIWERLEAKPDSPQSRRVRHILDLFLDLKERIGTVGALPVLAALRDPIHRYKWVNQIAVSSTGVHVGVRGVGNLSEDDLWEHGAVHKLLDLIQKPKGLGRLRRCGMCPRVFVANDRGRGRLFCTDACKQRNYDSDPKTREDKLAYMRNYYVRWVKPQHAKKRKAK